MEGIFPALEPFLDCSGYLGVEEGSRTADRVRAHLLENLQPFCVSGRQSKCLSDPLPDTFSKDRLTPSSKLMSNQELHNLRTLQQGSCSLPLVTNRVSDHAGELFATSELFSLPLLLLCRQIEVSRAGLCVQNGAAP